MDSLGHTPYGSATSTEFRGPSGPAGARTQRTMPTEQQQAPLERTARALEISGEGIWEFPALDPEHLFAADAPAYYSACFEQLLGRAGDLPPVLGSWLAAVHPEDRERVLAVRRAQLAEPGVRTLEYRVLVAGEPRWWHERSQARPAEQPGRWSLLGVVRDVSEERRRQEQAQRATELLRQTQAAGQVGGWEVDLVNNALYWTEETHRIHEVPDDFLPDLATAIDFYAPEHVPIITEAVQRCMQGEAYDVELDIITYKGRRIRVEAAGRPYYEDGRLVRLYGIFRDVTELRARQAELRRQFELINRQDSAIRALSTPIIQIWDNVITLPVIGNVDAERANHIMERLLGEVGRVRARFAVLDLTGVEEIDPATAEHLLRIVRAVNLLGARGLLCGLQPAVARSLTELDVDVSPLLTHRNLQEALKYCIRELERPARARQAPRRA